MSIENATEDQLKAVLDQEGHSGKVEHDAMMAQFNGQKPEKEPEPEENQPDLEKKDEPEKIQESVSEENSKKHDQDNVKKIDHAAAERQKEEARIRQMESRVGNLYKKVDDLFKAVNSQGKSSEQKVAALEDYLKETKKNFPEEAQEIDKLVADKVKQSRDEFNQDLEKSGYIRKDKLNEHLQDLKQEVMLDIKHKGWKTKVSSEEFSKWINDQDDGTKALLDSTEPDDQVALLDLYEDHAVQKERLDRKAEDDKRKADKLRSAVPATKGADKGSSRTMTESEAMMAQFNRGRS